ncbi:MAG TPA: SMI1/KNR4 family protein [Bacteroidia bacterium]|jgi:hypothetical protein
MTASELKEIEIALGITLPGYYKEFMLNYPEDLSKRDAPDFLLSSDYELLIDENLQACLNFRDRPLSKQFLIIGYNGCGDYYLINLEKDDGVFTFFHDYQLFYKAANSLPEYSKTILENREEESWGNDSLKVKDLRI